MLIRHTLFCISLCGTLLIGIGFADAETIFDIFQKTEEKEDLNRKETQISVPEKGHSFVRDTIDEMKKRESLSALYCKTYPENIDREYCQKKLRDQWLETLERKRIAEKRKEWNLHPEYCFHRRTYENYRLCESLLQNQQYECIRQETYGKKIIVDIEHQLLYGVKNCQLVVYSQVITGKNSTQTPPGKFHIYERRGEHFMQGTWFVTKAFYFWKGYALHDAEWRKEPYWSPETRAIYGSHGCVNTPDVPMQILWDTFDVGDEVEIYKSLPEKIAKELQQKIGSRIPAQSNVGTFSAL
ncbi:L,D-transpeptidase [Candidatus Peregrinibacteria bacterium]|nr:MAG: L,D-transpeptidase [Candidatus Peregrinibacteria bacterium]